MNKDFIEKYRKKFILKPKIIMADCCSRSVVSLITILLFVGIGGMVCGAIGTSWFTQSTLDTHIGLLKSCARSLDLCNDRKHIFEFKKGRETYLPGVEDRCELFL